MSVDSDLDLASQVRAAVKGVDDPEYPGISIVDLGLLEQLEVSNDGTVDVGLIPTFSGCPALAVIASDVQSAVEKVTDVTSVSVKWLRTPVWSVDRISSRARAALATEFTVAVQIGNARPRCPRCGSATALRSTFGPSRCRSVHQCEQCGEVVEAMRR